VTCQTIEIPLSRGKVALIDAADLELVSRHRWFANCNSLSDRIWYAQATVWKHGSPTTIQMHRLLTNAPPGVQVDHRNHNGLDNRHANLRFATPSQNGGNARLSRGNSSGYRGVFWETAAGKWRSQIRVDGKRRHLGVFTNKWDAAQAYNAAALEAFGEFAYQNVPNVSAS
jgi:hypothetical protein